MTGGAGGGEPLAARQAQLVAALVADGPLPAGFDAVRVGAARRALLRKRAGEAAKAWPVLAAALGPRWGPAFAADRAGTEPVGGLREGWDVARGLRRRGELPVAAAAELAAREAELRYDGRSAPRPHPLAGLRRTISGLRRRA